MYFTVGDPDDALDDQLTHTENVKSKVTLR
jgi:hypothetical protein